MEFYKHLLAITLLTVTYPGFALDNMPSDVKSKSTITLIMNGTNWELELEQSGQAVQLEIPRRMPDMRECNGAYSYVLFDYVLSFEDIRVKAPIYVEKNQPFRFAANRDIRQWKLSHPEIIQRQAEKNQLDLLASTNYPVATILTFKLRCAEKNYRIQFALKPVAGDNLNHWLQQQKNRVSPAGVNYTEEEFLARGKQVYLRSCAACHQANGNGIASIFPALNSSRLVRDRARQDELLSIITYGKPGTAMAAYAQQLSEQDIAAVASYLKSEWSGDKEFKPITVDKIREIKRK